MPDPDDLTQRDTPPGNLHGLDPGELLARGLHTVKMSGTGGPWEPPTPEELAKLLPQYRIESLLGRGGMGAVYKGVQPSLDRPVAIKLLPAELATDADFIARFQREARTLAKLQHSGIVAVYDFGQTSEGHLYFVMEYVDGTDLQHVLKGPGLKPEQALELIGQICDALYAAHKQGVIHRDIKPANILLTKDGRAKLADFGLARPLIEESGGLTQTNMVMGTPDYMAPEQRTSGTHADHRADIFALGVMLYEMLTGQRPHGAFQPPSHRVQVDVRIDEVVLKALQQEPARRYQQASEMKVDVDRIRTTPPEKPAPPKKSALRIPLIVLSVLAILAVPVVAYFALQRPSPPPAPIKVTPTSSDIGDQITTPMWISVQRSEDEWAAQGIKSEKGWLYFDSSKDNSQKTWVLSTATKEKHLGDVALRVWFRWEDNATISLLARYSDKGPRPTLTVWGSEMSLVTSNFPRSEDVTHRARLPGAQKLIKDQVGKLELAVIGNRVIGRLNGKVIFDALQAELAPKGALELRARNVWLRDFEYLPLDGIPDPWKALGWEVPPTAVRQTQTLAWNPAPMPGKEKTIADANGGWLAPHRWYVGGITDGAVRMRYRWTKGAQFTVTLREAAGKGVEGVGLRLSSDGRVQLHDWFKTGADPVPTSMLQLPPLDTGDEGTIEFAVVGTQAIARVNGQVLTLGLASTAGGTFKMGNGYMETPAAVRDVEFVDLKGIPEPLEALGWKVSEGNAGKPPPGASTSGVADAKKRLVEARAHLKAGDAAETRKLVDAALAIASGDLGTQAEAALIFAEAQAPERSAKLAQEFVAKADADHPQFAAITELRVKLAPTMKKYEQHLRTAAELVGKGDDAGEIRELKAALALVPDGKQAADKLAANPLHVGRPMPGRKFANELGYTFVPVNGLPNVLFSTWETRVKDFEQFVKETGHDMSQQRNGHDKSLTWQKPGFEQTGDHPVVMVTRRDANAFCRWLTQKERAAGRLQPGQVYRLPTDREWSAAMGVLNEAGDFPAARQFPADVVTWEKGTPQPRNAENLSGTKNDDFPHTAPVGSGRPNRFGLYDLMGNVTELCADLWSFESAHTVLRGSSHVGGSQRAEMPDNEGPNIYALPNAGFRCVLDFKTEEQRRVQIALEAATQKLIAATAAERWPSREIHTLVNEEMVLLDANRGVGIMGRSLEPFADIPITHFFADGRFPQTGGRTEAMKKWPLRVLRVTYGFPKEDYLESLRGLPLQWVSINQHIETGMPIKSLAPLAGMKLKGLVLENFKHLENLEPLRGMPLETLRIRDLSPVLDFTPVKDAPIRHASLPASASLETIFTVSTWWGEKAALTLPVEAALTAVFREPLLAGDAARVQKLVADIEVRLKTIPHFAQGKASEWTLHPFREHLRFAPAIAKWLAGDRAAFDGVAQTHNGHTYLSLPLQLSYEDAKAFAEKLGAHLVTITTPEESAFISKARETKTLSGARIGLERSGPGRMAWKWVTGEPLDFHNWGPDSGMAGNAAGLTNAGGGVWHWWHWSKADVMSSIIEWDSLTPQPPAAVAR